MDRTSEPKPKNCCPRSFYTHSAHGQTPPVVLKCCSRGRFWERKPDGSLDKRRGQIDGERLRVADCPRETLSTSTGKLAGNFRLPVAENPH